MVVNTPSRRCVSSATRRWCDSPRGSGPFRLGGRSTTSSTRARTAPSQIPLDAALAGILRVGKSSGYPNPIRSSKNSEHPMSQTLPHQLSTREHRARLRTTLAVASIAQFMVVLDVTIINVALPQMRADLHMSSAGQQWVINAYALTFAGFLMLGGRGADLFGRRRVFLVGLGIFTLCSLLGGVAQSGGELITARARLP